MTSTYQDNAHICSKFYDLILDCHSVSGFLFEKIQAKPGMKTLFVGGMFGIAEMLIAKGLDLVCADYSEDMAEVGRAKLPGTRVETADVRYLPFKEEFDLVLVPGRVFTHMLTDEDVMLGLQSCYRAMKPEARFFVDNYEDDKIGRTSYFNSVVTGQCEDTIIKRTSTTELISEYPHVVKWSANYWGEMKGEKFNFSDSIDHRAWSRSEARQLLQDAGFEVLEQGDNFDETSFYTVVGKSL